MKCVLAKQAKQMVLTILLKKNILYVNINLGFSSEKP